MAWITPNMPELRAFRSTFPVRPIGVDVKLFSTKAASNHFIWDGEKWKAVF